MRDLGSQVAKEMQQRWIRWCQPALKDTFASNCHHGDLTHKCADFRHCDGGGTGRFLCSGAVVALTRYSLACNNYLFFLFPPPVCLEGSTVSRLRTAEEHQSEGLSLSGTAPAVHAKNPNNKLEQLSFKRIRYHKCQRHQSRDNTEPDRPMNCFCMCVQLSAFWINIGFLLPKLATSGR